MSDAIEIRQQAGNMSGQFEVKGLVNANGALTTMTLDAGDVKITLDPKHLPFVQKGDTVFIAINVIKTVALKPESLPQIPRIV